MGYEGLPNLFNDAAARHEGELVNKCCMTSRLANPAKEKDPLLASCRNKLVAMCRGIVHVCGEYADWVSAMGDPEPSCTAALIHSSLGA